MDNRLARSLHRVVEPTHAWIYFAPETQQAYADAGLKGQWMGYFASRAAPMGAVEASVVIAAFYSFAPGLVARAIPDAWRLSTPERVREARLVVAGQGMRRLLGDLAEGPEVKQAAELARTTVEAADCAGRPLAAAHQELPWPEDPVVALWHACAVLREHRGDGHLTTLLAAELDARESLLTVAAVKPEYRDFVYNLRGWTAEELDASLEELRVRGLVDADGKATDSCVQLRRKIEDETDRLAMQPYRAIGEDAAGQLLAALTPLVEAIKAA